MACRLSGANTLSEPMLDYNLNRWGDFSFKVNQKIIFGPENNFENAVCNFFAASIYKKWHPLISSSSVIGSWGLQGTHLGPTGPRWVPGGPNEPCYQGNYGQRSMRVVRNFVVFLHGFITVIFIYPWELPSSSSQYQQSKSEIKGVT